MNGEIDCSDWIQINPPILHIEPGLRRKIVWNNRNFELGDDSKVDPDEVKDNGSLNEVPSSSKNSNLDNADIIATIKSLFDDPEPIIRHLNELLRSERRDDDLQCDLIDLLGVDQFDFIGHILSSRGVILNALKAAEEKAKKKNAIGIMIRQTEKVDNDQPPQFCQQVSIQSQVAVDIRKQKRREQKRAAKQLGKITQSLDENEKVILKEAQDEYLREKFEYLENEQWLASLQNDSIKRNTERYPYVYDASIDSKSVPFLMDGAKRCLPEGAVRISTELCEEISIPAVDASQMSEINRISVKDLDELGQKCFEGFEQLNIIQSLVFAQAYKSMENLLICAPTGAGKTNIALLAILNTIHNYTDRGVTRMNDFKVIYLAPMKALATEMTANFVKRLSSLGLRVRELTGDTMLSKKEITETQMLILTPEKWDVVTRKAGDSALTGLVRLLIIDEVHLLHDERGPVIEAIVARTLRQVEMSQQVVRIVGLSATLPNYVDVARFLRVNLYKGLFFFDGRFRPVPLNQTFIGVRKPTKSIGANYTLEMDEVCYKKTAEFVRRGHQVLVFVTSRNATTKLALWFKDQAAKKGELNVFLPESVKSASYKTALKSVYSCKNTLIGEIFRMGFGIHHAGLPRRERLMIEKFFKDGYISVMFCTATLAWGINLPAHAVIIRGTEIFNAQRGAFADMGVLDVQQIFGRAGRPQYETSGHGIILTSKKSLPKYLDMLSQQIPIESQLMSHINDNLNAEIALGTVSTIAEAVEWLCYTYFIIRARLNPLAYGIPYTQFEKDPDLTGYFTNMMMDAAHKLDEYQMIRYDQINGFVASTDLGRIASNYYVNCNTIAIFLEGLGGVKLAPLMTDDMILSLISMATEFDQMKVREDELMEMEELETFACPIRLKRGALATIPGKVNCLMQAYVSRSALKNYSLISESMYIQKNSSRLCRAMFEITLRRCWAQATNALLGMTKSLDQQVWPFQTPLRQLPDYVRADWIAKIESKKLSHYQLYEMTPKELGPFLHCDGAQLYEAVRMLPVLEIEASVKPITNTIIQISVTLTPDFIWKEKFLGSSGVQVFWIFVEDIHENLIIHHDQIVFNKAKVRSHQPQNLVFTVPVRDQQLTHNYQVRVASDRYVVEDSVVPISMHNCVLPSSHRPHTDLLDLDPLPIAVLRNELYQSIYKFEYFNPIQTQVFHCLYHTDQNVLIGAPTGSGKTLCAELAVYRILNLQPNKKSIYIAPLKALVRERVNDWTDKFLNKLGIKTVELTGDHTPDIKSLISANLVITTPEKWDGITRSWEIRKYVKDVALVIIDEIHLLGVERGAVLEAIVTRLNFMIAKSKNSVRIIGLSTALTNAGDVAEWLNVSDAGLFNFRPNVRPVPIQVHIAGFSGQHYCPRMALMNRPAFKAIKSYSAYKPTLIFVASRRQTRLTAMAFISQLATEDDPRQWLHIDMEELEELVMTLKDENLKLTLPFGIGIHHAGLQQHERNVVEQLFIEKKIQVLVATATLAWGINLPAHLVIVKGTEYFDGKTHKYIDFPVTDILQMIGRAGRPQYDDSAVAVIYVQDVKKNFYKKFLYEPFPVESSLLQVLANHVNAEICAGAITSKQQVMEYIAGTYLYRRIFENPSYYGVEETTAESLTQFLVDVVDNCVEELILSGCVYIDEESQALVSAPFGSIASLYYLHHKSVRFLACALCADSTVENLVGILANCPEFEDIPVRHNEDLLNAEINRILPLKLPADAPMDSSNTKANILLQAHFTRLLLPTDYLTDLRSVLDQCIRILQAMLDINVLRKWLSSAICNVILMQMIVQAAWYSDDQLLMIPHFNEEVITRVAMDSTIPLLQRDFGLDGNRVDDAKKKAVRKILDKTVLDEQQASEAIDALMRWPIFHPKKCFLTANRENLEINIVQDERWPNYVRVNANVSYLLKLSVDMIGPNRYHTYAYCPRFSKEKSAGWIVIVGEKDTNEVLSCRKFAPISGSKQLQLSFRMPQRVGRHILTVFVMSDAYLGIDQEYNLHCDVVEER